ncbi:TetR/AcrR family transcriptional regulator [Actinocorallia sp. B10E7]|uniref:TetR/AcrR family transcriptional regulator n=1 Tax=Actinocorallia sp. B10E7 TaxID=3153558 RepID=UPI00325D61AF
MPKVSPEHLERRRGQILDAATRCFASKGFHSTSMQDIFKESGLSAGAVYRYFPSKAEIVSEIATGRRGFVEAGLREILERERLPSLPDLVEEFLEIFQEQFGSEVQLRLLPEGWTAALRDEAIGEVISAIFGGVREVWTEFAVRYQAEGRLAEDADPAAVGALLTCLVPGFVMQRLLLGGVDSAVLRRGFEGVIGFS